MPYVARNTDGRISAVAAEATDAANEWLDPAQPELQEFLARIMPVDDLARSDQPLIRVVEDLVNTLIDKNLIRFTDLPEAAQQKLMLRRSLRRSRHSLDLLGDGGPPAPEIEL
jgi:hypothetical protein